MPADQLVMLGALVYVVIAGEAVVVVAATSYLYRSQQPVSHDPWALIALLNGIAVIGIVALLVWLLLG